MRCEVVGVIVLALAAGVARGSHLPAGWQVRNPSPIGNALSSIAFGNGMFVAVDSTGAVLTSSDGMTWTIRPIAAGLKDLVFGEGIFVAVGKAQPGQGRAFTSRDAVTWTERRLPGRAMNAVTYGNGMFVAAGDRSVCVSQNGFLWKAARSGTGAQFYDLTFGARKFLAVTSTFINGINTPMVHRSKNGLDWTATRAPKPEYSVGDDRLKAVAYGQGQFVASGPSGDLFESPDGMNWTKEFHHWPGYRGFAFGEGVFVAVGEGALRSCWNFAGADLNSVAYGNGRFVAVGPGGGICVSDDGDQWLNVTKVSYVDLTSVAWGNDIYLAVGEDGILLRSREGADWTRVLAGTSGGVPATIHRLAFGNGTFVGVGREFGLIITSADGQDWIWRKYTLGNDGYTDVTFGNGIFMALGYTSTRTNGLIGTSPDGIDWSYSSVEFGKKGLMRRVFHDGNYFIVVDAEGALWHSTSGASWSNGTPAGSELPPRAFDTRYGRINAWTYANGIFTAVGDDCLILQGTKN